MRGPTLELDLERTFEQCRAGDSRAWARLVDAFQAMVYGIPRRYRLTDEDAADVFQTTFASLHRSLDRIESPYVLPKWLAVTASRESLKVLRLKGTTTSYDATGVSLDEIIDIEEKDAEETALQAERALSVRRGLEILAGKCKALLEMLYFQDDMPYSEISTQLSMPIGAIGPTRARCLEKLKVVLSKQGFFE